MENPLFGSGHTEHLNFPGAIQMILIWKSKQYQEMIYAAKYLKVGKNHGFNNLSLCSNESLRLAGGMGVT